MRVIDFSAGFIPAKDIVAAGYAGVVCYVSESRPGSNFAAKPITKEYADTLKDAGLHIVSNFQYGKPGGSAPSDFTRGFAGGVADATTALRLHEAAGGPPSAPIFFSVDDNIDLGTWNTVAVEWFRGINSVLGLNRTGIYGHSRVCAWAIEDSVIGCSTTPGHRWAWQTRAWSCGQKEPSAVLYQDVIDTASNPGPRVGGIAVDVSDVLAEDFGQWDLDRSTQRVAIPPVFNETTEIQSPYHGPRQDGVAWFVLHTEDGRSNCARNLANYLSHNGDRVSYHYVIDNERNVFNIVDTDQYANACYEPGNSKSINLVFSGSWAKWSRQTWFDRMQNGIDIAAYIAARDTHRYGLQPRVISPEEAKHQTGITDHNGARIATGMGDHTDVGPGFPWDYFRTKLAEYSSPATASSQLVAAATPAYPGVEITHGTRGLHVIELQDRLNAITGQGLLSDGEYGSLTRRAVTSFQTERGLQPTGLVGPDTWALLFSDTKTTPASRAAGPAPSMTLAATAVIARDFAPPLREVTGRNITSSVHMELADLGVLRWDPDRRQIAAMFGDNFSFSWGQDWESPSIVMYDRCYNVLGIPGMDGVNQTIQHPDVNRRQLWPYQHKNAEYSTILPCDFIRIGDWWHAAVMVTQGLGNELRTEFHRSRDLVNWDPTPELSWPHRDRNGNRVGHPGNVMLTFDQIGDYVYGFGTGGLERNKGVWMWRIPAATFPLGWWEPWGYDFATRRWDWGIPNETTPILEGKFGELCFRYIQGNCVLSYFDNGAGKQTARTVREPRDDWRDGAANVLDYAFAGQIPQLYGGYISPLSQLNVPNGMHFFVSQWNTETNDPYRVLLVEGTLQAKGPLEGPLVCDIESQPSQARDLQGLSGATESATATPAKDQSPNGKTAAKKRAATTTISKGVAALADKKPKKSVTKSKTATKAR